MENIKSRVNRTEQLIKKSKKLTEAALAKARQLDLFAWADIDLQITEKKFKRKLREVLKEKKHE